LSNNHKDDKSRSTVDTDDIAEGVKWFYDHNKLEYLMEFLARYVRKVHSDRYLKKVLTRSPGVSFLDIIGPSDISYIKSRIVKRFGWKQLLRRGVMMKEETRKEEVDKATIRIRRRGKEARIWRVFVEQ
jgi:hypothetical protein